MDIQWDWRRFKAVWIILYKTILNDLITRQILITKPELEYELADSGNLLRHPDPSVENKSNEDKRPQSPPYSSFLESDQFT